MTIEQTIAATAISSVLVAITLNHIGFDKVKHCFSMWFKKDYWVNYNIVEFAAYTSKLLIIIPGLVFHIQIWQTYFLTLITSLALMWASNKKLLPSLVYFNTGWVWLSAMVIAEHLF